MKLILIGNGIELEFQRNLSKGKIIENALLGKVIKTRGGFVMRKEFPSTIKDFAEEHKILLSNIDKDDWENIRQSLITRQEKKSIEDIYVDAENSIYGLKGKSQFRELFLKYIDTYSKKININDFFKSEDIFRSDDGVAITSEQVKTNIIKERLDSYDLILTTNYTNFLSRNLKYKKLTDRIVYIHGEYENNNNPPMIGARKINNKQKHWDKVLSNVNYGFDKINSRINKTKITLDIYGWSFDNEIDLIKLIIHSAMKFIVGNKEIIYTNDFGDEYYFSQEDFENRLYENEPEDQFLTKNDIKKINIEINYYYFSKEDLVSFKKYISNKNNNWIKVHGIEVSKHIGHPTTPPDYEYDFFKIDVNFKNGNDIILMPEDVFKIFPIEHSKFKITRTSIEKEKQNADRLYNRKNW